jgi:hypothetical protein
MGMDLEAGASLVTAGLVASVVEADKDAGAGTREHGANCANCGAALVGSFCHACGQRAHVHRSLLHLGEEFLHGILHFDAKAWRTLPLLAFKPGQLTRRYLDGQRTRFVSPLALFLFMMFLMFFVGSITAGKGGRAGTGAEPVRAQLVSMVGGAKSLVALAEKDLAEARAKGGDVEKQTEDLKDARAELATAEKALDKFDRKVAAVGAAGKDKAAEEDEDDKGRSSVGRSANFDFKTGFAAFDEGFKKAMEHPDLTEYKVKSAATKYTFLLVPISLPFLWLMFWRRRDVSMYDHAVFTLYSLSFMALLFSSCFLLKFAGLKALVLLILPVVPPLHMFAQLRGTYGLGLFAGLWRTAFLLFAAGLVFLLYLGVILIVSVL